MLLLPAAASASDGESFGSAQALGGAIERVSLIDPLLAQADAGQPAPQQAAAPKPASQQGKGLYVTGAFGANWPTTNTAVEATNVFGTSYSFTENHSSGLSVEAGLGYDFGPVRAEVTYAYDQSVGTGYVDQFGSYEYTTQPSISKNSVLVSAYWDINLKSRFTPYVGGGIGYSSIAYSAAADAFANYAAFSSGAFAYQVKAGVSYLVNNSSDLFAEAVYRGMTGFSGSDDIIVYDYSNYNSWGFQIGARIRFGVK